MSKDLDALIVEAAARSSEVGRLLAGIPPEHREEAEKRILAVRWGRKEPEIVETYTTVIGRGFIRPESLPAMKAEQEEYLAKMQAVADTHARERSTPFERADGQSFWITSVITDEHQEFIEVYGVPA